MKPQEYIAIGYISKTHGLKGEITAIIENGFEEHDLVSIAIELNGTLVPHEVERISGLATKPFLKLEGVDTIEKATSLKGALIYIPRTALAKLRPGEFYDDELVGFMVEDKNLGVLGQVQEIQNQGANKLIVVSTSAKEILIPVNAPFITRLNKARKSVQVDLPDGFLDF